MNDQLTAPLDERLRAAVRAAYTGAPLMRRRLDEAGVAPGDIQTVADLARIPVLEKDDLVALQQADPPFGGLLGVPREALRHVFLSPGPLYEPDAGDDTALTDMAQLAMVQSGFAAGDVVLNTLSYHLVPAGLLLDHALTAMGCTVVPGGVGNSDLQLKLMADLGVTAYTGTPSFLLALLHRAADEGSLGRLSLRKAFLTAEPLAASARQELVETHGISVGNAYATAELGFLALNTDGGLAMRLLPEPIIQVVDPDTGATVGAGEVGEVVVTNFSRAYPLIRLGTGDMAVNVDPAPGKSAQAERSLILVGRRGEAVKVRGMFVHPNQLRHAAAQLGLTAGIQGVVARPGDRDEFRVRVVGAGDAALGARLAEVVRQICRVRVDDVAFVDALEKGAPGMLDERSWT